MIRSNDFHTYFRVNSVFWDPNIYGRYLALVIVVATAALLWAKERRDVRAAHGGRRGALGRAGADLLAVELHRAAGGAWQCWQRCAGAGAGRSATVGVGRVGGGAVVTLVGGASKIDFSRLNIDTSGRANLVSGGIHLFGERPHLGLRLRLLPNRVQATTSQRTKPPSRSPTQSQSQSPPNRA